jgi:hypothetical protein
MAVEDVGKRMQIFMSATIEMSERGGGDPKKGPYAKTQTKELYDER